jgi:glycosidase
MKKIKFLLILSIALSAQTLFCQTTKVKKVLFQAFWWDYKNNNFPYGWANYLAELAPRLKQMGFDAIWIPPTYKNQAPFWVGYGPMDHYDLGDKYQKGDPVNVKTAMGTKDELLRMIAVMHANGIEVIQDIVLNHLDGAGMTATVIDPNIPAGTSCNNHINPGIDPIAFSKASNCGYKNFRYTSYATPSIDESQNDYWTRSGRWAKNYRNFHPNDNNNCSTGEICTAYFGPDIDYSANSFGPSSNIPTSGAPSGYPPSRPYFNPPQSANYMYNGAMDWLKWFKKQTGVDGLRWDAVKHFDLGIQRDGTRALKYDLSWANGGYAMTNIGEWIGNEGDLTAYVNNMATASLGYGHEEHTGTFDFNLRGYGATGGIYNMVLNLGSYNMQSIYGDQQTKRFTDYATPSARVHRTIPFVNSHDTYRPILDANGNFSRTLGYIPTGTEHNGWLESSELGGNGRHIDPREPRMAAAYAAIMAMDGNPIVFFEDLFNVGTTGKRWTHQPTSTTDLPVWNDIDNLVKCHQKLAFKDGDYGVPSALTGTNAPFYNKGTAANHVVLERKGKAVIGITDKFNTASDNSEDEEVWVTVDASLAGKNLYDYSGAHGITTTYVYPADNRVLIKTAPVGHTIAGAKGHGYSVWAPAPTGVTVTSVNDLFNHLDTYVQPRTPETVQEWEMDNDLGDSHCNSLGQGGKTPDNSPNDRVVGKIFANAGTTVSYTLTLGTVGNGLTIDFYDLAGNILHSNNGSTATVTGSFANTSTRWITAKVRNTAATYAGQKCYVRVTYTAPSVVNTASTPTASTVSIWTSNGGSNDWNDCRNWEEGLIPVCTGTVIIPHTVKFMPKMDACFTGTFVNRAGLTLKAKVFLEGAYSSGAMNTLLRTANYVPTTNPYGGTETVDPSVLSITSSNAIVDWIKIELRDKNAPSTLLSTRHALLQADGDIVETDGVSPLYFNEVAKDDYYIVIQHRNHLAVRTSAATNFSTAIKTLNFTDNSVALSGANSIKAVSGVYVLYAGDLNGDGVINATDRSLAWNNRNVTGYNANDCSMNGTVDATDRSLTWNNRNVSSGF